MSADPVTLYWQTKLEQLKETLESNNFAAWTASDLDEAKSIFWNTIFPEAAPTSVSFGGSWSGSSGSAPVPMNPMS